jgi:hypothetical protein
MRYELSKKKQKLARGTEESSSKRRVRFLPNLYHRPTPGSKGKASTFGESKPKPKKSLWCFSRAKKGMERALEFGEASDVLEVWFAGCHSGE